MKSKRTFKVVILVGYLTLLSFPAFAETLTLSTYYPAPFGSYDRLKLVPRSSMALDPYCNDDNDLGIMYFDKGEGKFDAGIYVCQKKSPESDEYQWVLLGGIVVGEKKGDEKKAEEEPVIGPQKVACIGEDGRLGVCLSNPSADGTCFCQQGAVTKK